MPKISESWRRPRSRVGCVFAGLVGLALLLGWPSGSDAQPMNSSRFVMSTITAKTGFPAGDVTALAQTSDGYLWIGLQEGLARYDGVAVTMFTTATDKGLGNDAVFALTPGRDGSLWIGTLSGVSVYKSGVFRSVFSTSSIVTKLLLDRDDRLWVGTGNVGLYSVLDGQVRNYHAGDGIAGSSVYNMAQTADGAVWFGTDRGLVYYKDGRFRPYGDVTGPFGGHIRGIAAAEDGSLWIAAVTPNLYRLKDGLLTTLPLPSTLRHARVSSLFVDKQGSLWSTFNHDGAAVFQAGAWTRYTMSQGIPDNDVTGAIEDRQGNVWLGTLGGAVELRLGIFNRFGLADGLSEADVWTVLQARDGGLWVGTNSKGLDHIDKEGHVRNYFTREGLPPTAVYALSESPDGSLWIGSEHGTLSHLTGGRITSFHDPDGNTQNLFSILQADAGGLLLGQYQTNGLVNFSHGHFEHRALPGQVKAMARGPDGSVWVGADHGGLTHLGNGSSRTYTVADGLSSKFLDSVYVDAQGVAWVGTIGNGVNRIEGDHITRIGTADGLFDDSAGAIVEDNLGYLWMTSERGIYKVRRQDLNLFAEGRISSVPSIQYGLEDGLTTLDCNFGPNPSVWKGVDGRIWFTTTNGIESVDPAHSGKSETVTPPLIERVLVDQVPVDQVPGKAAVGLKLGPKVAELEIHYASPEMTIPQRLRFRYRLSNLDSKWTEVGSRRTAYFTHLPPGSYVFEVQAADASGEWTSTARLNVLMEPHFWQTRRFAALCAVLLIVVCMMVFRLRMRYLVATNRKLERKVFERTSELEKAIQSLTFAHEALYEQATRDSLTRLWNRQFILEKLAAEYGKMGGGYCLSIVMADIDHFKSVNDTYGHQIGDRVLQEVAARISRHSRSGEYAGRYGGEEFIIVLPGCSRENAARRAEELRLRIAQDPVMTSAGALSTSCSLGVATALLGWHSRL